MLDSQSCVDARLRKELTVAGIIGRGKSKGARLVQELLRLHGIRATDGAVHGADHVRAAERLGLVDDRLNVRLARLLIHRRAAQIAIRAHARADAPANEPRLVELALHVGGIDVRRVFNRDLDGLVSLVEHGRWRRA